MSIFKKLGNYFRGAKANPWIMGMLIFTVIIFGTVMFLWARGAIAQRQFEELSAQIHAAEMTEPATVSTVSEPPATVENLDETMATTEGPTEPQVKTMLAKYVEKYEQNPDFFGWIRMGDTTLDYPVMQSVDGDNEKYLHLNFDGAYSAYGVPFADIKCTRDSDNIIIYGHNQNNGTMFRPLFQYEEEAFFKENPTIMFSDLYGDYEYEILAVFLDQIYKKSDTRFKYYQFIDAENEEAFDYAVSQFKEKSLYDTGVDAEYGDSLIMLITCSYHVENGRFVVVARRKTN